MELSRKLRDTHNCKRGRGECNNGKCQSCHCHTEQKAFGKPLSQRRHQRKARRQAADRMLGGRAGWKRLAFPKTEMEGRNLGRRATLNARCPAFRRLCIATLRRYVTVTMSESDPHLHQAPPTSSEMRILGLSNINA